MSRSGAGRRPGAPDTRGEILDAARTEFGEHGFEGATVRRIAGRAGVDAALVHHYFGSKEKLFLAALEVPLDPGWIADEIVGSSADGLGERAIRTFLAVWGDPVRRGPLLALLRSAMSHAAAATMLRQFVTHTILRRMVAVFDGVPDGRLRAEAMVAQLIGIGFVRYVVKVEPLASAADEDIVALVGPVLQRYVDEARAER